MSTIEEETDIPKQKINGKVAIAQASGGIVSVVPQANGKFTLRAIFFDASENIATKPPSTVKDVTDKGMTISDAPWFEQAKEELARDVREIKGAKQNPRILEYHKSTDDLDEIDASKDEIAWCSSFVNFCMQQVGVERTKSALAKSWLKWGQELDIPRKGCVVVFERPSGGPNAGHVGFFVAEDGSNIELLGGNQGDRISISPQKKSRKLSYRWPI
ncbi:hypothetical protein MGMO_93c00060 [Methyloglobulus morosus KoM1]|uniref:Peptidase C51 domain-containing protein n=1 Tax=Methyloglobulus morosus KoM1 TaxID=1116472 RepID=V5C4I3_9GAMM|nr:TIGR02594 family protein [Methyloglobulus morosus]ESS71648.1 hypothetical protein MGMO_93c00060 [Methyloglobulus morosus KoM1]